MTEYGDVKDLLSKLSPKPRSPAIGLSTATIKAVGSVANGCSILLPGDNAAIPGVRYLIDAYTPRLGDIVLVMKYGTDMFVLGRTTNVR